MTHKSCGKHTDTHHSIQGVDVTAKKMADQNDSWRSTLRKIIMFCMVSAIKGFNHALIVLCVKPSPWAKIFCARDLSLLAPV